MELVLVTQIRTQNLLVVSLFVFCLIEIYKYIRLYNYMLFALCHGLLNLSIMVICLNQPAKWAKWIGIKAFW